MLNIENNIDILANIADSSISQILNDDYLYDMSNLVVH